MRWLDGCWHGYNTRASGTHRERQDSGDNVSEHAKTKRRGTLQSRDVAGYPREHMEHASRTCGSRSQPSGINQNIPDDEARGGRCTTKKMVTECGATLGCGEGREGEAVEIANDYHQDGKISCTCEATRAKPDQDGNVLYTTPGRCSTEKTRTNMPKRALQDDDWPPQESVMTGGSPSSTR